MAGVNSLRLFVHHVRNMVSKLTRDVRDSKLLLDRDSIFVVRLFEPVDSGFAEASRKILICAVTT